jgi:hypothetical protein
MEDASIFGNGLDMGAWERRKLKICQVFEAGYQAEGCISNWVQIKKL